MWMSVISLGALRPLFIEFQSGCTIEFVFIFWIWSKYLNFIQEHGMENSNKSFDKVGVVEFWTTLIKRAFEALKSSFSG